MIFCIVSNIGSVALFLFFFFFVIQSTAQQSFFIHFKKRNLLHCKIVADALMAKYVSTEPISPVLIMYTDWCPEHCTFVSAKIAVIALQTFSDLTYVLVTRIAPGHLFRNPSEKINCMLNLELYGIGVMSKPSTASNLSTI